MPAFSIPPMFPHFFGLFCAALALSAFALAHRQALRQPLARRARWLASCAVLASPALYNAAYYLHTLPEASWFYEARSRPGVELLVIPAGIAGGLLAACLPRRFLVLSLLATVGVCWGPFLKPVLGPIRAEWRETWARDVCLQSTFSTCGPASAATILRHLGFERGEREIARAAHSYLGGTEAWYLARYLRKQEGIHADFVLQSDGFPETVRLPAIVGVTVEGRGHFIALIAREGDWFSVGDPMIGPEKVTREMLLGRYGFTGFALEISRREAVPAHVASFL